MQAQEDQVARAPSASALGLARHFVKAMRPVQWVKNVFVLAPLVFGLELDSPAAAARAGVAFMLFCLVSSAVYLLNDIADRDGDARHPTKRLRPIASGALPVDVARIGVGVLVALSLAGGVVLDWRVSAVLGGYFVLNIAYTAKLKHVAYVDIACIALGFLLRVLAGGLATRVAVSVWLLACTFLLASLLALGKRRHELLAVQAKGPENTRAVLEYYRVHHIDWAIWGLAIVTVLSYTVYTMSESTRVHFGTNHLVWSVPFVLFGIMRFAQLMQRHDDAQSPTDTMVRDAPFLVNVLAWAAVVTTIIYTGW